MYYEEKSIQVPGSDPNTKLHIYIRDCAEGIAWKERPLIVICPGGGYEHTSNREAEPIAFQFLSFGYNVAVLRYSVSPATYPTALLELTSSVIYLKQNASKWHIDTDQIYICGFSAGGHLAASYGVFWHTEDFLSQTFGVSKDFLKPNGLILGYPVITSNEFAHRGSFQRLLGDKEAELSEKMSLEKRVNEYVPRCFIWHTFEDTSVPLENSLLFAESLRKQGIPFEYHVFPKGHHGLALANKLTDSGEGKDILPECTPWISLVHTWIEN